STQRQEAEAVARAGTAPRRARRRRRTHDRGSRRSDGRRQGHRVPGLGESEGCGSVNRSRNSQLFEAMRRAALRGGDQSIEEFLGSEVGDSLPEEMRRLVYALGMQTWVTRELRVLLGVEQNGLTTQEVVALARQRATEAEQGRLAALDTVSERRRLERAASTRTGATETGGRIRTVSGGLPTLGKGRWSSRLLD